ncbi:MAG: penicillin-binding protein activator LpoB [Bacteriovoracaceae bacterium]|jgi:hypothetical protein|nr:penicillin-binding protein activator LpoB [Bacteriovoracaceae bacterium]
MKILLAVLMFSFISCTSFKAQRVGSEQSDEKGLAITDNWMSKDTNIAVKAILKQIYSHKGYKKYIELKKEPKIFIAEVQNDTSEPYFPIKDLNDELLYELSQKGDFVLVDAAAREKLLEEITYQNDGMVDPKTVKMIGRQLGADFLIFGNVYMKPETRSGKTIKEYSVNLRVTDLEKGIEVIRTRKKVFKYSDQKAYSW